MSSISGRFLCQFGITAAVEVMVSLLVSFTLTPMMSAGGGFIGGVAEGRAHVQLLPHRKRVFSPGLLLRRTFEGRPLDAFRKTASQKEIMQG